MNCTSPEPCTAQVSGGQGTKQPESRQPACFRRLFLPKSSHRGQAREHVGGAGLRGQVLQEHRGVRFRPQQLAFVYCQCEDMPSAGEAEATGSWKSPASRFTQLQVQ